MGVTLLFLGLNQTTKESHGGRREGGLEGGRKEDWHVPRVQCSKYS